MEFSGKLACLFLLLTLAAFALTHAHARSQRHARERALFTLAALARLRARISSNANKHQRRNGRQDDTRSHVYIHGGGRLQRSRVRLHHQRVRPARPVRVVHISCSRHARERVRMGVVYINRAATAATMHPLTLSYCFHCLHKYTRTSHIVNERASSAAEQEARK